MSVLLEFSIFPTTRGEGLSAYISPIIAMIRDTGINYRLTAMGTIIETDSVAEALGVVEKAHALLDAQGCDRVYASIKMDIRKDTENRMDAKIASVEKLIGDIHT